MKVCTVIVLFMWSLVAYSNERQFTHTFHSTILEEARTVTVHLPDSYHDSDTHYPTVYVLDGEADGELVASTLRRMAVSEGAREQVVVTIHATDRLRDYAPTINNDPRGPLGQGGGGDKFLDYMEKELVPFIGKHYRVNREKTLSGHSVGGLLVMHSFHSRPHLFNAHLAFSPAVWWGEQETLKATEEYVLSNKHIHTYLYMNIGAESGMMRRFYNALVRTISRNRNVDLYFKSEEFDGEPHGLTFSAGLYSALRGLARYNNLTAQ